MFQLGYQENSEVQEYWGISHYFNHKIGIDQSVKIVEQTRRDRSIFQMV